MYGKWEYYAYTVVSKTPPFFILLQLQQTLTSSCNIWRNIPSSFATAEQYWFTRFTYILLIHIFCENFLPARQCVSIPCASDDRATASWNTDIHSCGLLASD